LWRSPHSITIVARDRAGNTESYIVLIPSPSVVTGTTTPITQMTTTIETTTTQPIETKTGTLTPFTPRT